tara:strand:- start:362 stop:481 length:120 start_codon:yes stop_codon:yes gene_type:complete
MLKVKTMGAIKISKDRANKDLGKTRFKKFNLKNLILIRA